MPRLSPDWREPDVPRSTLFPGRLGRRASLALSAKERKGGRGRAHSACWNPLQDDDRHGKPHEAVQLPTALCQRVLRCAESYAGGASERLRQETLLGLWRAPCTVHSSMGPRRGLTRELRWLTVGIPPNLDALGRSSHRGLGVSYRRSLVSGETESSAGREPARGYRLVTLYRVSGLSSTMLYRVSTSTIVLY